MIRGGYGIYLNNTMNLALFRLGSNPPWATINTFIANPGAPAITFDNPFPRAVAGVPPPPNYGSVTNDFGVGYSSLGQLRRLPAQTLKIDASFISQIPEDINSCSITEAIIAMAKRLRLRTVAEGVETTAQLDFLRANGCDAYQGYLFAKPLTSVEVTSMFKAQRAAAA